MIKVLRVSTHPSKKSHGVGLHPHKISETSFFFTIYNTFMTNDSDELIPVKNYKLKISSLNFEKRPLNSSFFKILFFHLKRFINLIIFSIFCIKNGIGNKIDIVHIHSPMYIIVAIWAKLTNKLTCITYHGTDYLRIRNNMFYKIISKKIIDIGFCISPHMMNDLDSFHKKVIYIPNGIDSNLFKNLELKREKIILAVGALKKEKSYENLIKSYAKILIKYPEYQLNIAGDGYLKNDLIKLVKDLKIKKKVKFLGNLNKNELVEIYNKSEIFVLSSSSEGFPKVVLEAILCGCRVIATNVGSITEFMPAEYIIPDCSVNNIYKYLDKILNTADYNINIEELKNKYSWQNVITKYKNTYESYVR